MVDVNSDGELDVIMGFGTGADMAKYPQVVCQVYFNQNQNDSGCGGGVMALDGHSGQTLWHTYTLHEIFALNCNLDIDGDKVNDCLAAGRMAVSKFESNFNSSEIKEILIAGHVRTQRAHGSTIVASRSNAR